MNMINPSEMTPEALHQFLTSAAEELERGLPDLIIAIDKIRAARKGVMAMAHDWTRERPTEPGYYWFKGVYRPSGIGAGEHQIIWLNKIGYCFTMYGQLPVDKLDGSWAGPLLPPPQARKEETR